MGRALLLLVAVCSCVQQSSAIAASTGACRNLSMGPPQVVVSDPRRDALGLDGWPDGAMGVVPRGDGTYDFYGQAAFGGASRAQRQIVTTGTLADPTAGGIRSSSDVAGVPAGYTYVGGGPVFRDASSGLMLQLIHLEHAHPDNSFTTEFALGRVDPASGVTTFLGTIVRPQLPDGVASAHGWTADMGASTLTVRTDGGVPYLYTYFPDFRQAPNGTLAPTALSAARAPLADVVVAARSGTVTPWFKRWGGVWNEPALGGRSDDLQAGQPMAWTPAVIPSGELGQAIMVAATSPRHMVLSASTDGVTWSPRLDLFDDPGTVFDAYPTVAGDVGDPADAGHELSMYYLQWPSSTPDWTNATVVRRVLRCDPMPPLPTPAPVTPAPAPSSPSGTAQRAPWRAGALPRRSLSRSSALRTHRLAIVLRMRVRARVRARVVTTARHPRTLASLKAAIALRPGRRTIRLRLTRYGRSTVRHHHVVRATLVVTFVGIDRRATRRYAVAIR